MAIRGGHQQDRQLPPGTMVGEYRITKKLGEGGMGEVYAAVHPLIGKRVAVKILKGEATARPDLVHRFQEEARAVNKIGHPNIIDVFAFNQLPDGRDYFVMEFLEGQSLGDLLEVRSLEMREARQLLRQLCDALEAAHRAGVVHRDLKPDNIWIGRGEGDHIRLKLLDFGIAKLNDGPKISATQMGVAMGTPHYMPPEQAMGRQIDARADIYALGILLYRLFTGTLPFHGATIHEIVMKHVWEAPTPPSQHGPVVPEGMETVILNCLAKEPEGRPASALSLSKLIEAAFEAGPRGLGNGTVTLPPSRTLTLNEPMFGTNGHNGRQRRKFGPAAGAVGPGLSSISAITGESVPARPGRIRKAALGFSALVAVGAAAFGVVRLASDPSSIMATRAQVGASAVSSAVQSQSTRPAAPAPAPAPAPSEAVLGARPQSTEILLEIDSVPRGAEVLFEPSGEHAGRTPLSLRQPAADATQALRLEMTGFKLQEIHVPMSANYQQTVTLTPLRARSKSLDEKSREQRPALPSPSPSPSPLARGTDLASSPTVSAFETSGAKPVPPPESAPPKMPEPPPVIEAPKKPRIKPEAF